MRRPTEPGVAVPGTEGASAPGRCVPWVISVDDHVVEPPTLWTSRLSSRDRQVGPRVVRDTCRAHGGGPDQPVRYEKGGDGAVTDWWLYEDVAKPIPTVSACAGIPPEELSLEPISFHQMRPGCYDPAARLTDMDINRVERSMCFPNACRFAGQMFLEAKDKELALRCVQAYNDWIAEEWTAGSGGRLIPLGIVPLWDPDLAAAEVDRNARRGFRAVAFTELPSNLGLPSIHDPRRWWDPFFTVCNETRTAVCMHIGSGSRMIETSPFAPYLVDLTLTFANAQLSMVEWLVSGILARFPDLRIVYSESQVGWMPFVLERLDKAFHKARMWASADGLIDRPPSFYVPGRVYGCLFDDDVGIANRDAVGVDQILFEVDYPHQDSTWPGTASVVERVAAQVGCDDVHKIMRTNAIDLFGLDPEPLASEPGHGAARPCFTGKNL